jgi:hypothetical protein
MDDLRDRQSQPSLSEPACAFHTSKPRVGTMVKVMAPLSTSITCTPSWRPPCKVRKATFHVPLPPHSAALIFQFAVARLASISTLLCWSCARVGMQSAKVTSTMAGRILGIGFPFAFVCACAGLPASACQHHIRS